MSPRLLLLGVLAGVALSGCTHSSQQHIEVPPLAGTEPNGEQSRTGEQLLADARDSIGRASSLHLTGSLLLSGRATPVDLTAAHDGEMSGSIGDLSGALQVQVSGGVVYIRPTGTAAGVVARLGLPAAVAMPTADGSFWALDPTDAPGVVELSVPELAQVLLPKSLVATAALSSGDVDGTPVVTARAGAPGFAAAVVSVAVTGDVRLVRLVGGAAGPSGLDIDSASTTAPPPLATPVSTPTP